MSGETLHDCLSQLLKEDGTIVSVRADDVDALRAAVEEWIAPGSADAPTGRSSSTSPLWACMSAYSKVTSRNLVALITSILVNDGDASAPLNALRVAASRLYMAWVCVPGAAAYGVFDVHLATSALFVIQKAFVSVPASAAATGKGRRKGKAQAAASTSRKAAASSRAGRSARAADADGASDDSASDGDDRDAAAADGDGDVGMADSATAYECPLSTAMDALRAAHRMVLTWNVSGMPALQTAYVDSMMAALQLQAPAATAASALELVVSALCSMLRTVTEHRGDVDDLARLIAKGVKPLLLMSASRTASGSSAVAAVEMARVRAQQLVLALLSDRVPRATVGTIRRAAMRHAARGGDSDDEDGERDENDGPVAAAGAGAGAGAGADRDDAASDAAMLDMPCTANAFDTLLQHMCIGVPDRAEPRSLVVASAVQLADVLPPPQQRHWVRFLVRYSRNKKPLYRQCAVEVSAALLLAHSSVLSAPNSTLPASSLSAAATPSRNGPSSAAATPFTGRTPAEVGDGGTPMEDDDRDVSAILVDVIVQRCVDRSPTVRAKALELLAQVLREASAPLPAACPALFRTLLKRCSDERPGVRKSAVQALMALCARPLDGGDADDAPRCPLDVMGREGVLALVNLAADDSTLVRRCAAECIAEVLRRHPTHDTARRLWLDAVLPLVGDKEASVEAAGVKLMREAIIAALLTWKSKNAADADGNLPWLLLQCIAADSDLQACLRKALQTMKRDGALDTRALHRVLRDAVVFADEGGATPQLSTALRRGAWLMLAELAALQDSVPSSKTDLTFVLNSWRRCADSVYSGDVDVVADAVRMLQVTGMLCRAMDDAALLSMQEDLLARVATLRLPPPALAAAVTAIARFSEAVTASVAEAIKHAKVWAKSLLDVCEATLRKYAMMESECGSDDAQSLVCSALFVVGELAVLGIDDVREGTTHVTAAASADAGDASDAAKASGKADAKTQRVMVKVTIPSQVVTLTHTLVSRTLSSLGAAAQATIASAMHTMADVGGVDDSFGGGSVSMNASGDRGLAVPDRVRAHAFVALGKLCLRDGALAKKVITTFVRELRDASSGAAIRSNVLLVLADLCIRYTSLVDRFVPTMATCIKDRHPMIRKHAVITLTQLLLEDYVKLRGSVFFQYLSSLADPDVDIRETATPGLLSSRFVEALYALHGCKAHPVYASVVAEAECDGGNVRVASRADRLCIFRAMLKLMPAENRLSVASKLAQDVLGAVVDELLPVASADGSVLDETVAALIEDAIEILSLEELRFGAAKNAVSVPAEEVGDEADAPSVESATHKLVSQLARKHVLESVVPTLIALKRQLAMVRSPLVGCVMQYLGLLLTQYKDDIESVLAADRSVGEEVLFDLRRMAEQKKQERRQKRHRRLSMSSPFHSPGGTAAGAGAGTAAPRARDGDDAGDAEPLSPHTPAPIQRTAKTPGGGVSLAASASHIRTPLSTTKTPSQLRAATNALAAANGLCSLSQLTTPRVRKVSRTVGTRRNKADVAGTAAGAPDSLSTLFISFKE